MVLLCKNTQLNSSISHRLSFIIKIRIISYRIRLGLSQRCVALRMKIPVSLYRMLEQGLVEFNQALLRKASIALRMPVSSFYNEEII